MNKNPLYEPKRLVSLWNMIQWSVGKFCSAHDMLTVMGQAAYWVVKQDGRNVEMGDLVDGKLSGHRLRVLKHLQSYLEQCKQLELPATIQRTTELIDKINSIMAPFYWADNADGIDGILQAAYADLNRLKFVFIPPVKHPFFQHDALFGTNVNDKFPEASQDIKNAGTCIAVGLPDAAIFHLCRAAEWGLRALAVKWKVKLKAPIDLQEWGMILDAIDKKLATAKLAAKSHKKKMELEHYTNLSSDCRAVKETWRDCIMHARGSFLAGDADATCERVKSFLQRLAKKV
jgi:hypothetical protein